MDSALQTIASPRWPQLRAHAVPLLAVLFTLWLIVVPLVTLLIFSFRLGAPWQPGAFTFQHYVSAYSNPQVYIMFLNTAVLAAVSTALALAIAVFFAFLTERTDMPFRNIAWGLMLVPMAPCALFPCRSSYRARTASCSPSSCGTYGITAGPAAALGVMLIVGLAILTINGRWIVSRLNRQEEARG